MRQFNYKYRSYLKNNHGFINMIPHFKFFHPYMGFTGYHGPTLFQSKRHPYYAKDFCKAFRRGGIRTEHKVKVFFPEIKNGAVAIGDIKYSVSKGVNDYVDLSYTVDFGNTYQEYIEIKDFIAEFKIYIDIDFGDRVSIEAPVVITCDFIELLLYNQKISITSHEGRVIFMPYLLSYNADNPPEIARAENNFFNSTLNGDLSYGFIIEEQSLKMAEELNIEVSKMDQNFIDIQKTSMGFVEKARNREDIRLEPIEIEDIHGASISKYIIKLPQTIFPDRMNIAGNLPIFNPEHTMNCCEYLKAGQCTPYGEVYGIEMPLSCTPIECPEKSPCQDINNVEVANKVLTKYIVRCDYATQTLDDKSDYLSNRLGAHRAKKSKIKKQGQDV